VLLETFNKHVPSRIDDDAAILLVDDDLKTLELLEETLRTVGYETQSVRSGARALEILSSKLIGAVLLDLLMPGMDGFQVIRHIRSQETLKHLPILVMTGKTLTTEELTLLGRETQAWLPKNGSWEQQLVTEIQGRCDVRRRLLKVLCFGASSFASERVGEFLSGATPWTRISGATVGRQGQPLRHVMEDTRVMIGEARDYLIARHRICVRTLCRTTWVVDWRGAVQLGVWLWFGFVFMILVGAVVWDNVPWKLTAIHAG